MAAKDGASALEFIREQFKKDPGVSFADVKAAAEKRGFKIYPIMYGRAMMLEGLVKGGGAKKKRGRPKGSKNKPKTMATGGFAIRRGPGRPRKNVDRGAMAGLDAIADAVKNGDRYRGALEQIGRILQGVL